MEVKMFGAARTVTGSCYALKVKSERILVDCGMFQGGKKQIKLNYQDFGFDPKNYDAMLLTHAHLDHCGRIPKLINQGFKGKIYATKPTIDLVFVVLMDAAKIAFHDTRNENKRRARNGQPPREPIYTDQDVKAAMKLFVPVEYNKPIEVRNGIRATFVDAGHILGAASLKLEIADGPDRKSIVFSGDIGQLNTPIVNDPTCIKEADYVFIESTYGNREHPKIDKRKQKFLKVIWDTYKKHGKLMIPSFAIERTQELLYNLNEFTENKLMPEMSVFLDSPMAIKATEIFKRYPEFYDHLLLSILKSGDNPFSFPGLVYSKTVDDSKAINQVKEPCIVIAGSGMCTAGRIKHHIKNSIDKPENTLLFVGFQAEGTLGYWIKRGEKRIRLLGTVMDVRADIESIDAFSGHADYHGLLAWLKCVKPKPKRVIITHGNEDAANSLSRKITQLGIDNHVPKMNESITF